MSDEELKYEEVEMFEQDLLKKKRIDLTKETESLDGGKIEDDMDDFDLLEATINPTDVKSIEKVKRLQEEIDNEKMRI